MEEWKAVKETNGMIEVSNMGRVRSLLRGIPYLLKTQKDSKGYQRLRVTIDQEKRGYKLHRLVAEAFIDNPDNLPQVNHIDGNKDNNRADNLEWISNRDNAKHAVANGLWESNFAGINKHNESLKKRIIGICHENHQIVHFESVADAERYVGSKHVTDVLKGKRAHAKGWSFSYERG